MHGETVKKKQWNLTSLVNKSDTFYKQQERLWSVIFSNSEGYHASNEGRYNS
jgi:hypothetical protein